MSRKNAMQMTAAEFKRAYMNRDAQRRATSAVLVRSEIGASTDTGLTKTRKALRQTWDKRNTDPKAFHKPGKAAPVSYPEV